MSMTRFPVLKCRNEILYIFVFVLHWIVCWVSAETIHTVSSSCLFFLLFCNISTILYFYNSSMHPGILTCGVIISSAVYRSLHPEKMSKNIILAVRTTMLMTIMMSMILNFFPSRGAAILAPTRPSMFPAMARVCRAPRASMRPALMSLSALKKV